MTSHTDIECAGPGKTNVAQETGTFPSFPRLPKELRLQIWELAIPRERLIKVSLQRHHGRRYEMAAAEPRYQRKNRLNKPISGERYRAVVRGHQLHSKFLRVSSEARAAALAVYRVHVPVYLAGPRHTERAALYFSPEHDVLHVAADAPVAETLVDFLWDLKAHDPRDVGLLRLGVDLHGFFCANDLPRMRKSDLLLIRHRHALVETLRQLREVWFMNIVNSNNKNNWCPPPTSSASGSSQARLEAVQGHRAPTSLQPCLLPVMDGAPAFERVGADRRRGVEMELKDVYMGRIDPREMLFRWRRLLRTWGVEHDAERVAYRMLLSSSSPQRRAVADSWSGGTCDALNQAMGSLALEGEDRTERRANNVSGAKLCREQTTTSTPGFWLFPTEAVGKVGEGEKLADMDFQCARRMDLTNYRPDLVILRAC